MITYTTIDGDILDEIVWRYYGKTEVFLEAVLKENRSLADYDEVLPAGVEIVLPNIERPNKKELAVWD